MDWDDTDSQFWHWFQCIFFSNATKKLTQFWQYLPRTSIISHNSRARSHKSVPPYLRCQSEVHCLCFWFVIVQWLRCVQLFATPRTAAYQASLCFTISWSMLKLMSIGSVMLSNHLILCRPLLLPPSIFPNIKIFSNESALHIRWLKYWSFSFSISPSDGYSGLISFRIDCFDLPAVQGALKSFLQYHSSKASILRRWAFFTVQLSHPYMTTGKTIALTRWTFVSKVISLLFNMLSRFVIVFFQGTSVF